MIRNLTAHYTADMISQAISDGEDTDLFHIWLDADIVSLIRSGTLGVINGNSTCISACDTMLPQIQDAIFHNGNLYAIPTDLSVYVWEKTAQGAKDIQNFQQVLTDDILVDNAFDSSLWTRFAYVNYVLQQYIMAAGDTLDFSSDTFLACLQMLKDADLPLYPSTGTQPHYIGNAACLLIGFEEEKLYLLPPAVPPLNDVHVPARLMVYLLNPNSKHKESAMQYLSYLVEHYNIQTAPMLWPNQAEPCLFPFFEEVLAEQAALGYPVEPLRASMHNTPLHWAITENALAFYRDQVAPRLDLRLHPLFKCPVALPSGTLADMISTIEQYLNGSISMHACTSILNQMADAP